MNFSEFKKRLGAEPLTTDPEVLAARESSPEFEQAARDAASLERKLEEALRIDVDEEALLDTVLDIPTRGGRQRHHWMAWAAGILVVAGIATLATQRFAGPDTLDEYVEFHFRHDGSRVLARASEEFDANEVNLIMARFGYRAAPELVGKVAYIKLCPTLDGEGAHMIVSSDEGPVTVIFMPGTNVDQPRLVRFDGMEAQLVALDTGSVAIITEQGLALPNMESLLKTALNQNVVDV